SSAVASANRASSQFKGNYQDTTFHVDSLYSMLTYYWRVDEVSDGTQTRGDVWTFRTAQLAFPGAEGYGRFARGGRGGKVVKVTNLNNSGPGSLREAVNKEIGPRTIIFEVSGMIYLDSTLNVDKPYITVAGPTAPGKGIAMKHATFGGTRNDAIDRFMRVRLGADNFAYAGLVRTEHHHSLMHPCPLSCTPDVAFRRRRPKKLTLPRTVRSAGLNVAGHDNYPPGTAHGYAASIGGSIG